MAFDRTAHGNPPACSCRYQHQSSSQCQWRRPALVEGIIQAEVRRDYGLGPLRELSRLIRAELQLAGWLKESCAWCGHPAERQLLEEWFCHSCAVFLRGMDPVYGDVPGDEVVIDSQQLSQIRELKSWIDVQVQGIERSSQNMAAGAAISAFEQTRKKIQELLTAIPTGD